MPPSLAIAQLQQQQTTTTPSASPSSSLISPTIPPLTPEEQAQQNRLQNVIAATTANLNETEKQVSGVVFTPRWSEPVWVNANSIAVLIAYCLPGEFADSGQEILGGFGLEVLESYAIALPQGFMAWMAVVGNQADDVQQNGRRLPAALGVICASDLNNTESRILSPQEKQEINNVIQQFITIQNMQVTNIDQVINIIDNVTAPPQNGTGGGGGMTPPTTTEPPLRDGIIPNATSGFVQDRFELKTNLTGGTPPYFYDWDFDSTDLTSFACSYDAFVEGDNSCLMIFTNSQPLTHEVAVTVRDSVGKTASDTIQITVRERLPGGAIAPEPGGVAPPVEGLSPRVPPTNDTGAASASATESPLRVEAIANATQAVAPATIRFDANITGGAPPYSYSWSDPNLGLIDLDRSITLNFFDPGTFTYILTVTDSRGKTVTDNVQIVISERVPPGGGRGVTVVPEPGGEAPPGEEGVPLTVEIMPNATQAVAPATFQFDSKVTGGTEPYNYRWKLLTGRFTPEYFGAQLVLAFQIPGTYTIVLNVTDSTGRAGSDSVEITIGGLSELPPSDIGEVVSPPPEGGGVLPPPETGEEGGELPGGLPPSPADDTEGEEGTPPSTREEEPPTNDTGGG